MLHIIFSRAGHFDLTHDCGLPILLILVQFQYFLKDPVKYDVKYQVMFPSSVLSEIRKIVGELRN